MKTRLFAAACPLALLIASPALAQAATPPGTAGTTSTSAPEVEVVVVTAQKREQAVLDVPLAVTAYGSRTLERLGIEQFDDLAAFTPGLEVQEQSPNNPGFVIRGLTSDDGGAASEPRVSVYQDGVSISRARGAYIELFDIERVEVAKGPQSTLFGRGALIGAVNVIQNKASFDDTLSARVSLGAFNSRTLAGVANWGISDSLGLRVAGIYKARDGYIDNAQAGDPLMGQAVTAFRIAGRWEPTEAVRLDLVINHQEDTPSGTSFKSRSYAPRGGDTSPFTPAGLGIFADSFGSTFEGGRDLGVDRSVTAATLLFRWQISDSLSLSSITAWRQFEAYEMFDPDGFDQAVLLFAEDATGEQASQEFRLNYQPDDGIFSGFAGVSWFSEDASQRVPLQFDQRGTLILFSAMLAGRPVDALLPTTNFPDPNQLTPVLNQLLPTIFGPQLAPLLIAGAGAKPVHREEFANFGELRALDIYADGTLSLLDGRLELTAGVRWTQEDKSAGVYGRLLNGASVLGSFPGRNGGLFIAPTPGGSVLTRSETFDSTTWRAVASYRLSDGVNLWASAARGRRPDVIAPSVSPGAPNFTLVPAEVADSVEAGVKFNLLGGRLQGEASVFSFTYENFQTTVRDSNGNLRTINAGGAGSDGFEAQLQAQPVSGLTILATYAFNKGRFDRTDSAGQAQVFGGNKFRLSPDHSASLGVIWEQPVANDARVRLIATYSWQSEVFFNDDNDRNDIDRLAESQDAYGLLNLRARYTTVEGWYAEAAVSNALDTEYLLDAGNTGGTFGIPTFIAGAPRIASVTFGVQF